MSLLKFSEITSLSNTEISRSILETETELFNIRFKKATRQGFKSHEIKVNKCRLAQLKTILTSRVETIKES